jgi:hypothetical protein
LASPAGGRQAAVWRAAQPWFIPGNLQVSKKGAAHIEQPRTIRTAIAMPRVCLPGGSNLL